MNDTMIEAIAQSPPSGAMSKRARKAAQERLRQELFGDGLKQTLSRQPSKAKRLRRQAAELRELASRRMHPKVYKRKAAELEKQAAKIEEELCTP